MRYISIVFIVLFSCFTTAVFSQQYPYLSGFEETRHIWNPAMLHSEDGAQVGIYARQQWIGLGFDTAPRFVNVHYQHPFEDHNMSAGINLYSDKSGPVSNNGVSLQYAYHIPSIIGRYAKLSLGLVGSINSFSFDPSDEVYREDDDPLLITTRNSTMYPSAGGGIAYISNTRLFKDNNFFFGLSGYHAFSTNVLIQSNNFERQLHLYGHVGSNLAFDNMRIEPSISVNYTQPEIIDFLLNVKFEMEDLFWAGLSLSSVSDLFFQGGYIVPNFNGGFGELRVGVMGAFNIGETVRRAGPGFELFLNYRFDD